MDNDLKDSIIAKAMDAKLAGDAVEYKRLMRLVPVPPGMAMELKNACGADVMRRLDRNYSEAEAKYGPDWLEK